MKRLPWLQPSTSRHPSRSRVAGTGSYGARRIKDSIRMVQDSSERVSVESVSALWSLGLGSAFPRASEVLEFQKRKLDKAPARSLCEELSLS